MKVYQFTFDLHYSTSEDYQKHWQICRRFYGRSKNLGSTWLIACKKTAKELYEVVKNDIGAAHMLISEITTNRQGWLKKSHWDWIREMKAVKVKG